MQNSIDRYLHGLISISAISTPWWQLTQHFGFRGRQEHQSVIAKDFSFQKHESRASKIVFAEEITRERERQSGLFGKSRLQLTEFFKSQSEIVNFFRRYFSKLQFGMENSGPFYLQPTVSHLTNIWYKKTHMGINIINTIIKVLISKNEKRLK